MSYKKQKITLQRQKMVSNAGGKKIDTIKMAKMQCDDSIVFKRTSDVRVLSKKQFHFGFSWMSL